MRVRKNNIGKILYFVPLFVGICIMYGALSGKLQYYIDSSKNMSQSLLESDSEDDTVQIPAGKINLYEWFDEWITKPLVEVYDPDNKIPRNYMYGFTQNENTYYRDLYNRQQKITNEAKIPKEYIGSEIFNKDKIKEWDEQFEIKHTQASYEYSNLVIKDDFSGLDSNFYTEYKQQLLEGLDENGKLSNGTLISWEDGTEITNVQCKLVMFDITIIPHSDWVVEGIAVPELKFLVEDGNALKYAYKYYSKYGELNITGRYPIYYDLGLYNVDTASVNDFIYYYPMRKGEEIKFRVGYIVPVEMMDIAYFIFNPDMYITTNFSYATDDIAIFKIN